jgi:predicted dinucleotide-binding enzyme
MRFIQFAPAAESALDGADAAVVATPWPQFLALSSAVVLARMKRAIVIDPARHLQSVLDDPRVQYFAVGQVPWPSRPSAGRKPNYEISR